MTDQPTQDLGGTAAEAAPAVPPQEPAGAPEVVEAEVAEPQVAEPEAVVVVEPQVAEPEAVVVVEPQVAEPEAVVVVEPEVAEALGSEPQVSAPPPTEPPAAAEPRASEPLVLEPNTAEPVTAELAVEEPEVAQAVVAEALADAAPTDATTAGEAASLAQVAPPVEQHQPQPTPHVPTPAVIPAVHHAPEPAVESTADPADSEPLPESFGRVDPDGTVWVRTTAGEVQVGQYQAGSPDEAIAYYVRKYLALETEVVLLEQRLAGGADVAVDEAAATVDRITAALDTPQVVGDIDRLRARVAALAPRSRLAGPPRGRPSHRRVRLPRRPARRSWSRPKAWPSRRAGSPQATGSAPCSTSGRSRRASTGAPSRRSGSASRRRATASTDAVGRTSPSSPASRRRPRRPRALWSRRPRRCSTSTDWAATATQFRGLMDRWKAAGRASRSDDDALWTRFRAAQDTFFAARSAAFDERDAGQAENLAAKEALATEAEALLPLGDLANAKAALRDIQERWEKVGHVPRGDKERVEGRLRRVEQASARPRTASGSAPTPRPRPAPRPRSSSSTTAIAKLEKTLASATAAGDAKKVRTTTEATRGAPRLAGRGPAGPDRVQRLSLDVGRSAARRR